MPREIKETHEASGDTSLLHSMDVVRTVAGEREDGSNKYRREIRRGLIHNREETDRVWNEVIKSRVQGFVREHGILASRMNDELHQIGLEYRSRKDSLDTRRRDGQIDDATYNDHEVTLRANFHVDRFLAFKKVEKENESDDDVVVTESNMTWLHNN